MKNIVHKSLFLIAFVVTMCFASAYAAPADPSVDSIVASDVDFFSDKDYADFENYIHANY